MKKNHLLGWTGLLSLTILACSCGNTRQLVYMQGKFDTARLSQIDVPEPVIQKGDLLSIIIYSDNPQATAVYNQPIMPMTGGAGMASSGGSASSGGGSIGGASTGMTGGGTPVSQGYLVNDSGNIQMYGIGPLHVLGLTKAQVKDSLDARLDIDQGGPLKHPFYTIRFLNYRVTMLGEVAHPGIFSIPGEHMSLLEAIGLAGDLTFFGRRDNVLVIRQSSGKREYARLDLTNPDIMASPFFYLEQNDVVIVEPTKKKIAANDQVAVRNVSLAAAIVSTIALLYSIFRK